MEILNQDSDTIKRVYNQPRGITASRNGGKLDPMTTSIPTEEHNVRTTNWMTCEWYVLSGVVARLEHALTLANIWSTTFVSFVNKLRILAVTIRRS
jgi:hypothetical protein